MIMREAIINFWNTNSITLFSMGRRIATALLIALAGRILIGIIEKVSRQATGKLHFDETLAAALRHIVRYGTIIIAVIMILDVFGINTTSLIAILGAAGVTVGLALRDTLSNIAAGIILLFLRYYKKGDYIEAGALAGSVRDMNLFATILETPDGVFIAAPNSSIWGAPIKNYSRNSQRRIEINVAISYSDSIEAAFRVMQNIIAGESRFLTGPAPQMMVKSLGDSGVNLMLRAWVSTENYWAVYWEQSRNIKEQIEAAGLTIPFPQRDVRIVRNS
jgi:small conductance mechanosensitive channel